MQQHSSKYFTCRPTPDPGDWVKRSKGHNSTFKNMVTLGLGLKSKFNFSEYGHVVYQTKGNDTCSNMVANILPADSLPTLPTLGVRSNVKNQLFRT